MIEHKIGIANPRRQTRFCCNDFREKSVKSGLKIFVFIDVYLHFLYLNFPA